MAKHADAFIALPGESKANSLLQCQLGSNTVPMCVCVRWLWNHGGTSGDNSVVSAWNP